MQKKPIVQKRTFLHFRLDCSWEKVAGFAHALCTSVTPVRTPLLIALLAFLNEMFESLHSVVAPTDFSVDLVTPTSSA